MASAIGLSAVFANLVVFLVLTAAFASRKRSQLDRLATAAFAFVCAWLINAAFEATRPAELIAFLGGAVIVASIVAVLISLHRWAQGGASDETQTERRGDEGGGGPRRDWPDAPQHDGGGSDPSWWPEFERRLALYVAERDGEKQQPVVPTHLDRRQ